MVSEDEAESDGLAVEEIVTEGECDSVGELLPELVEHDVVEADVDGVDDEDEDCVPESEFEDVPEVDTDWECVAEEESVLVPLIDGD